MVQKGFRKYINDFFFKLYDKKEIKDKKISIVLFLFSCIETRIKNVFKIIKKIKTKKINQNEKKII